MQLKKGTILLVEDNSDDQALTLRALKRNNIVNEVVVVGDGVEALDYLFARGEYAGRDRYALPQLILLDLKLPKLNGFEVLRHLQDNDLTRMLPVVILTSSKEQEDLLSGYSLGANSYIRKPVDFDEFMETIKQLVVYWLALNEVPAQE